MKNGKVRSLEREKRYIYVFLSVLGSTRNISGDDYMEEIPVPIPNTEVKLSSADNTCELPCWKDRLSPVFFMQFFDIIYRFVVK